MFKRGSSVVKRLNVFLEHKFPHLAWINFKQRLKREKKHECRSFEITEVLELELLD